jgi:hypothetical protein
VTFIFGTLKGRLAKHHETTKKGLFCNATEILELISEEVQVLLNWMTRLGYVLAASGDYV